MGSKRKPFITSKAVSEAVLKSGEGNDWSAAQVMEIWELAAMHLNEPIVIKVFDDVLYKAGSAALFHRRHYMVTGSETLRFDHSPRDSCNPTCILSDRVRSLIRIKWPLEISLDRGCQWHDFSDSLLIVLMKMNVVPNRLKGKKLEQDLGL